MEIIEKKLLLTAKELISGLENSSQCLRADAKKAKYIRNVIGFVRKEFPERRFATKVRNGEILVWRIDQKK